VLVKRFEKAKAVASTYEEYLRPLEGRCRVWKLMQTDKFGAARGQGLASTSAVFVVVGERVGSKMHSSTVTEKLADRIHGMLQVAPPEEA
jgi:hypothetical protein